MDRSLFGILNLMQQHQDMDFVQRVMKPEGAPKLYDNKGGIFGEPSTHSMAADTDAEGNAYMYPTVVMQGDRLRRLSREDAWGHAQRTGERIPFGKDLDTALWFSKNYKKAWRKP